MTVNWQLATDLLIDQDHASDIKWLIRSNSLSRSKIAVQLIGICMTSLCDYLIDITVLPLSDVLLHELNRHAMPGAAQQPLLDG